MKSVISISLLAALLVPVAASCAMDVGDEPLAQNSLEQDNDPQGGPKRTKQELLDAGYTCERAGVGSYECTKPGSPDYLCDNEGTCMTISAEHTLPPPSQALSWATASLYGTGGADLIAPFDDNGALGLRTYRANGTGYDLEWTGTNLGSTADSVAWLTGDVSGTGRTDLIHLWSNHGRLGIVVYSPTSSGFTVTYSRPDMGQGAGALAWRTGDVNHDGKVDILQPWANGNRLGMIVYVSNGIGFTISSASSDIGPNDGALAWLAGDVDHDGKTDLVTPFSNGGRLGIRVFKSNGQGLESSWSSDNMGQGAGALAWLTGDVNGDGKMDLIQPFANGSRLGMLVYESDGTGYATTFGVGDIGQGAYALAWLTGDIDGDGKTDVMQPWTNVGMLGLIDYRSTTSGLSTLWGTANMGQGPGALAWLTGDVDGDGRADIIQPWANGSKLGMIVYRSTGHGHIFSWGTGDLQ